MAKIRDLTGQYFGRLKVLRLADERYRYGDAQWVCVCECGNQKVILSKSLVHERTRSCGCLQKERAAKAGRAGALDITRLRSGFLVAIRATKKREDESVVWECICDCGGKKEVSAQNILSRRVLSCGCWKIASRHFKKSGLSIDDIPIEMVRACKVLNNNRKLEESQKNEIM